MKIPLLKKIITRRYFLKYDIYLIFRINHNLINNFSVKIKLAKVLILPF